jgi:hypothetical protein
MHREAALVEAVELAIARAYRNPEESSLPASSE